MPDASKPTAPSATAPWKPQANPWLIAIAVMLATVLEVLDTSVANVALPHMAGNLSASTEEATWVLTSYLVSNAIVLPMTGWLSATFGRKRFLLGCVILFIIASGACGAAPTLGSLVFARIVQGAAGGALQPLSQAILMESFPPEKRGVAMAVFGLGVVVAPIIGPTLGGWITDNYSWRWIFYINLPLGLLALMMCQSFIEDPPYLKESKNQRNGSVDYIGFAFMSVGLATLQIILDQGQQVDWFSALWLRWFTGICVFSLIAFVFWELHVKHPIVDLRVLKDKNFAAGTVLIFMVGIVLYSTVTMLPLFLQNLLQYPALDSGMALSPRGMGAVLSMIIVGKCIGRVDSRLLIGFGFTMLAAASWKFGSLNMTIGMGDIIIPNVVMGLGMGFVFVPLTTTAMGGLPVEKMGNAAGIFNLMRNIGGGVGISIVTTMLSRGAQANQAHLAAHTSQFDPVFRQYAAGLTEALKGQVAIGAEHKSALAAIYRMMIEQATLLSFIDIFRWLAVICALCIAGVFILRKTKGAAGPIAAH
ncbi:DHA2 family efflux MFS transporter permease subunit [Desulfovibrio mangrovi]|uniref:DHA2 family efflux MFS transporter permease subunit n=1 Tax=Desulfovibrio mangrovi TaxID=2976983 RepID=UPI0022480CEE|nr:DHA2 family efflux MFS transporter permease subunit [Desulfovibrio mangrovi]UZP67425.1 DHA2 family efflux MFS transporter permease subunit [Desulfovibrio mangrovi]